jgi:hypothetical protein
MAQKTRDDALYTAYRLITTQHNKLNLQAMFQSGDFPLEIMFHFTSV